jgi:hypothetical protein
LLFSSSPSILPTFYALQHLLDLLLAALTVDADLQSHSLRNIASPKPGKPHMNLPIRNQKETQDITT